MHQTFIAKQVEEMFTISGKLWNNLNKIALGFNNNLIWNIALWLHNKG
jgi:hypothetical protein